VTLRSKGTIAAVKDRAAHVLSAPLSCEIRITVDAGVGIASSAPMDSGAIPPPPKKEKTKKEKKNDAYRCERNST
jgi:hypothetical protein